MDKVRLLSIPYTLLFLDKDRSVHTVHHLVFSALVSCSQQEFDPRLRVVESCTPTTSATLSPPWVVRAFSPATYYHRKYFSQIQCKHWVLFHLYRCAVFLTQIRSTMPPFVPNGVYKIRNVEFSRNVAGLIQGATGGPILGFTDRPGNPNAWWRIRNVGSGGQRDHHRERVRSWKLCRWRPVPRCPTLRFPRPESLDHCSTGPWLPVSNLRMRNLSGSSLAMATSRRLC
ncbi:hypothetical protein EV363DRAFT_585319 [Boletus edulis]|nr:hypothetical protein EV363DRAFT_585319 [Boletus edulis]